MLSAFSTFLLSSQQVPACILVVSITNVIDIALELEECSTACLYKDDQCVRFPSSKALFSLTSNGTSMNRFDN